MRSTFGVLGEICAHTDGRAVQLGPARQRCVLAALLANANRQVSADELAERVWGPAVPRRAAGTLRSYLSRLRTALLTTGTCHIRHGAGGYLLEVDETDVDLHAFHRLLARARAEPDDAAGALYEQALGLWRGEAFANADTPWFVA